MHSYFTFAEQFDKKTCLLSDAPEPLDAKRWRISKGLRMDHRYPPEVVLPMSPDHRGIVVPDLVNNTMALCIASKRLKELLEAESKANLECLPLSIANHKGRIAATDYFIINVLDHVDCVDDAKSDVDRNSPKPGMYSGLHRLFIHEDRVPPEARLFRLKPMPAAILIRDDLRASLDAAGITGVKYVPMGERHSVY